MKILITGTSGFIGTNLLKYFVSKGHNLLAIDIQEPKENQWKQYFRKIDITDFTLFSKAVLDYQPDYIIHLAARTDLRGETLKDYSVNIKGVYNLMRIVDKLSKLKKVIITSSMLVCHTGYIPKDQFDYSPTTLYGNSKIETERIVWNNKPKCDWAIIRPTSIWGPWFGEPYRNFFDMVITRKYFHIGRKGCTKTYGYIENAMYQIEQILFQPTLDENHKVYYIGDQPPTNIEKWANEISHELGYKIIRMPYWILKCAAIFGDFLKIIGISFPMTSFRLHNMTTDNIIDLSETYKLAPNPPCSRVDGVRKTLSWLKSNVSHHYTVS